MKESEYTLKLYQKIYSRNKFRAYFFLTEQEKKKNED